MVTQPAYLANLKAYARSRIQNSTEISESVADYSAESDRGAIILAATNVEDMLEIAIWMRMPGLVDDEATRKRIFEQDGQLSTFSKKIEMAYALGVIDREYRKRIDLIREIRNACAHSRKPISMKVPVLRLACEAAMPDVMPDIKGADLLTIRNAFVMKCVFISHYIQTGEKIEGRAAILKEYEKLLAADAASNDPIVGKLVT
jgi:hypothetical protein